MSWQAQHGLYEQLDGKELDADARGRRRRRRRVHSRRRRGTTPHFLIQVERGGGSSSECSSIRRDLATRRFGTKRSRSSGWVLTETTLSVNRVVLWRRLGGGGWRGRGVRYGHRRHPRRRPGARRRRRLLLAGPHQLRRPPMDRAVRAVARFVSSCRRALLLFVVPRVASLGHEGVLFDRSEAPLDRSSAADGARRRGGLASIGHNRDGSLARVSEERASFSLVPPHRARASAVRLATRAPPPRASRGAVVFFSSFSRSLARASRATGTRVARARRTGSSRSTSSRPPSRTRCSTP